SKEGSAAVAPAVSHRRSNRHSPSGFVGRQRRAAAVATCDPKTPGDASSALVASLFQPVYAEQAQLYPELFAKVTNPVFQSDSDKSTDSIVSGPGDITTPVNAGRFRIGDERISRPVCDE
uniref:PAM2 domain-containing protein n=1 Tax=Macrostomum lignano TaxID=282301 RepID=A0A1I8FN64_9PLAT